jgi:hypothetical protein
MIPISVTQEAYLGHQWNIRDNRSAAGPDSDGLIRIWLDPNFADQLGRMQVAGESYRDVILRLAFSSRTAFDSAGASNVVQRGNNTGKGFMPSW